MTNEPQTPVGGPSSGERSAELVFLPGATRLLPALEHLPDSLAERDREIESLWFSLSDQLLPAVAIVAVPPVIDAEATFVIASRIAAVGATVCREPVVVVDGRGVIPADGEVALDDLQRTFDAASRVIVVLDAPTLEPGSMPLIDACGQVVLVVGLSRSRRSELERLEEMLQAVVVVGAVYVDPSQSAAGRRERRRRRGAARAERDAVAAFDDDDAAAVSEDDDNPSAEEGSDVAGAP